MSAPHIRPYGSWTSPITAAQIASGAIGLSEIRLDGDAVYWLEMRPTEGGRSVVVRRRPDGTIEDVIPEVQRPHARARVRRRLLCSWPTGCSTSRTSPTSASIASDPGGAPAPITPPGDLRYADFVWDARRRRIICVREDHTRRRRAAQHHRLVGPQDGGPRTRCSSAGRDFYAAPRLSPDGDSLAWLEWSHPAHAVGRRRTLVAPVESARRARASRSTSRAAPASRPSSPSGRPDGTSTSCRTATTGGTCIGCRRRSRRALTDLEAEFATPPWVFGMQQLRLRVPAPHRVRVHPPRDLGTRQSRHRTRGASSPIDLPYTDIASVQCRRRAGGLPGRLARRAAVRDPPGPGHRPAPRRCVVRPTLAIDPGYLSAPEPIEFPTEDGRTAHGLFYPPRNPDFVAPPGERPPLVVMVHGGPTSGPPRRLRLNIQYYTSRGIAVLDVNYGGSTGYGRAYRERLYGAVGRGGRG